MTATTSATKKTTVTWSTCTGFESATLRRAGDAEPGRRHGLEPGGGDLVAARLAAPVGAVFELAQRGVDVDQRLAERPDQRVDLSPFRRDLTRVGEALVVRTAVDAERPQFTADPLALGGQLGVQAR